MLQLALLVLWTSPLAVRTRASIPATALSLAGSVAFALLSYAEHLRSVRPSILLNGYLFLTLLFDISQTRTLWLQGYNDTVATIFNSATSIKLIIIIFEAAEKQEILKPDYQTYPPEATGGIFNRSLFWWLNPLFRQGFLKILVLDDLFAIDKHLASERIQRSLESAWNKGCTSLLPHIFAFFLDANAE
jgi:ATP-binding cassette, subfamily C (CFTR/MRP), member 1